MSAEIPEEVVTYMKALQKKLEQIKNKHIKGAKNAYNNKNIYYFKGVSDTLDTIMKALADDIKEATQEYDEFVLLDVNLKYLN